MNIKLLQNIDHHLGPPVCFLAALQKKLLAKWNGSAAPKEKHRILVIKFWGIGSITQLRPSLRYLKNRYPNVELHFLTLGQQSAVAKHISEIDHIHTISIETGLKQFLLPTLKILYSLRKMGFSEVFDFEFFTNFSALCCAAIGAKSVGFKSLRIWRNTIYDVTPSLDVTLHIRQQFLKLAGSLEGVMPDDSYNSLIPFDISEETKKKLQASLKRYGIQADNCIVINPNAGGLFLGRRWPAEHFAELASKLARTAECTIVLIGNKSEEAYVQKVAIQANDRNVLNLAGEFSLIELIALLSTARMYVGNDSGPLHLAAAQGVKTLSLFGPESPNVYGPHGPNHVVIYSHCWCSPCINVYNSKRVACSNNICITQVQVELVYEKCIKHLKSY